MTLDDFRKMRDDAQVEWRDARDTIMKISRQIQSLYDELDGARRHADDKHREYQHARELFRTARDFNLRDLKQAKMVLKLRGPVR